MRLRAWPLDPLELALLACLALALASCPPRAAASGTALRSNQPADYGAQVSTPEALSLDTGQAAGSPVEHTLEQARCTLRCPQPALTPPCRDAAAVPPVWLQGSAPVAHPARQLAQAGGGTMGDPVGAPAYGGQLLRRKSACNLRGLWK